MSVAPGPWKHADWLGACNPPIPEEIPLLDPAMQAEALVGPVRCWGSVSRTAPMAGTFHCYSYDYRFRNLMRRPWKLPRTGCHGAVEPNWTLLPEMEDVEARALTLIKRQVATTWQAMGVRIWVDLNVPPNHAHLNLIGVPFGWLSYATRAHRETGLDGLVSDWRVACDRGMTDRPRFMVVGGSARVREFCDSRGWAWVVEHSDRVRGRLGGRARQRHGQG